MRQRSVCPCEATTQPWLSGRRIATGTMAAGSTAPSTLSVERGNHLSATTAGPPNGDEPVAHRFGNPGIELSDPGCVAETYPNLFANLADLGRTPASA